MARIPMGNFGKAMPEVQRIQMPQQSNAIAQGLEGVSQTIGQYVDTKDKAQQEAELSAKRLELFNNDLAKQEAKVKLDDIMTTEMNEQVTLVKNGVSNGDYNAKAGQEALNKWSEDRYKQIESELPEFARPDLNNYWRDNVNRQASGLLPLQLRADMQKGVVLADRYGDIASRYDRKQGRAYLESNLASLNLPAADIQARVNAFESGQDILEIEGAISSAIESKDTNSLHQLITKMDNGGFGYTDGQTLQQKKNQVLSRIDAIDTQVRVEENKRNSEASKLLNDYKANVLTGRAQDSEYENNVSKAVAGTESETEFKFLQKQSVNFQRFANKSTSEQQRLINEQKAKMKNTPSANAADEEKILNAYEDIYKSKLQTAKTNPNQVVREAGLQVHSLGGNTLKSNPSAWIDGAVDNGISQLSLKDANITLKPISEEDLPEAKKAFDGMGVNEKLNFISGLISKSKGHPNGSRIWGSVLGQLGSGDQNYVAAGLADMNKFQSTEGRKLSTSIVNGTQILKNKQLIMPKDAELKAAFNSYVGNTVSGTSANNAYNVFRAVYADTMEARNLQHDKADEQPNKDVLKFALAFATGGVHQQSGSLKNYMGGKLQDWKVAMPYGMTDDTFESRLDAGYASLAKHTGMTEAELKTLRLRQSPVRSKKGEIQYDLLNERGNPLQIDGVNWRIMINGATK
ncbi:methyl-coenzyme M reductase [Acinetobacter sp. ANC 4204]|uniref:methyl-coenzyme M reductase n=1 Tax=Acinetobacter sp. ANC 4204 TaxID=1977884 RepID=UPI000A3544E0|nr:methyl-coenzyme M reductase [Acinetobacter sp. ANC 4204]OTG58827.1 methyl-coenzyme M reductase [Acinetobacter sp. ANC 4204]